MNGEKEGKSLMETEGQIFASMSFQQAFAIADRKDLDLGQKAAELQRLADEFRARAAELERARAKEIGLSVPELDVNGATPEAFTAVPGLVDEIMRFTMATAPRPNRVLAFAGAFAFLAHIMGRRYTDKRNSRPNIYLIALADSGVGKQQPRIIAKRIAFALDLSNSVFDQIGSGEGVEDAAMENPAALFLVDEVDTLFNQLKSASTIAEGAYRSLLTFYSESSAIHTRRVKAKDRKHDADATNAIVVEPSVTVLGNGIPDKFYQSLSMRALENGLVARCLVVEAGRRGPINEDQKSPKDIPDKLLAEIRHILNAHPAVEPGVQPDLQVIPDGEGVADELARIRAESDRLYDEGADTHDHAKMAIWNRAYEQVCKFALIYAVSENPWEPVITAQGLHWAWKLYQHSIRRMLAMCSSFLAQNEDDARAKQVLRFIQEAGRAGALRSDITKKFGLMADDMNEIAEKLIDEELIGSSKGRKGATIYRAIVKKED